MSSRVRAVLLDLSGTLHVEDTAIPGAAEAVKRLKANSLGLRFATNTTKESQRSLWERLMGLGFDVQEKDIFTSLTAARDLVVEKRLKPYLMLEEEALADFKGLVDTGLDPNEADAVVVGLASNRFNYNDMNTAFKILLKGSPLIAIHKGRYYKRKDGLALGPGPFVRALEFAAETEATVVGKPEAAFFMEGIKPFGCPPGQVVMVGDDVRDDVGGAQSAGLVGILVKTGKYREGDENRIDPPPNHVCSSIKEAVDLILTSLI